MTDRTNGGYRGGFTSTILGDGMADALIRRERARPGLDERMARNAGRASAALDTFAQSTTRTRDSLDALAFAQASMFANRRAAAPDAADLAGERRTWLGVDKDALFDLAAGNARARFNDELRDIAEKYWPTRSAAPADEDLVVEIPDSGSYSIEAVPNADLSAAPRDEPVIILEDEGGFTSWRPRP